MRFWYCLLALGACASPALAAQPRRAAPREAAALESAIADIEAGHKTTPLVSEPADGGEVTVTFLVERLRAVPRIVSDVTGWGEHIDGTFDFNAGTMTRVGRTNWYSLQAKVAPRARIEYLVADAKAKYRLDPHNPRQAARSLFGGPPASEFVTPGYVAPREFTDPPVSPTGLITESTVQSRVLGGPCRLIVYTPPNYPEHETYPLAVFLDSRSAQVSRVLDWLIAHEAIEPLVAVFVVPEAHAERGGTNAPVPAFVTDELLPWVASRYAVTRTAEKRAIVGISYGAKDALDAAVLSGDAFGGAGLLLPGRRIGRSDISLYTGRITHRLRVAILAGQYDQANLPTAQSLRKAFTGAGHHVDYTEVPEGHSSVTCFYHLRAVLVSLFAPAGGG